MLPISRAARREHHFQRERGEIDELHRDERTFEKPAHPLFPRPEAKFIGLDIARKNDARNFVGKQIGVTFACALQGKAI